MQFIEIAPTGHCHDPAMTDGMGIAASGMAAASLWFNAAASNIVNQNSSGPVPATPPDQAVVQNPGSVYQPLSVAESPVRGGGVAASLQASLPAYSLAYSPGAPYANMQGMVAMPNVDLPAQLVSLNEAAMSFRASLAAYQASSGMYKALLNLVG
jgi:flagellar basal body rod protein FlgC